MSNDKGYNGWANYETWCVALWIDNEESLHIEAHEMAREVLRNPEFNALLGRHLSDSYQLSKGLKNWIEEMTPDLGATMWSDLLNAAMSEVNWTEVAEHYLGDVRQEDEFNESESEESHA